MTPADRIKKHLVEKGIKQTWLAQKIGMGKNALNARLHNHTKITTDEIEAICGALGLQPNDILRPRKGGAT